MTASLTTRFLDSTSASLVERLDVPPRAERRLTAPERYRLGSMAGWLMSMTGNNDSVWRHQALALDAVAAGENVVLATSTASGKTLVYQAALVELLLNSDRRALLLFPQKALAGDQLHRALQAVERAGLDPSLIGAINGDVPMADRDRVLESSRIVLATPDVVQSWLMRQLGSPLVQTFLKSLVLVVIDEAHVFEGVFGSNSAYLFRRLRDAQRRAVGAAGDKLQFIAATATIKDPAGHMKLLTGCEFQVIAEEENGAPFHGVTLLHVDGPAHGSPAERYAADVGSALAPVMAADAFIFFHDGRQGVERITRAIGLDKVLPYRGGYDEGDRRQIEASLRSGTAIGIIATSALELGIDFPQFTIGLNIGVPQTRKALRQRVGRIGRNAPGVFAVVAPPLAFAQLGSSFQEFYEGSSEPSHLYLGNQFIQFQQARCLLDENAAAAESLGAGEDWPDGFSAMLEAALPGGRRSAELDHIAQLGADSPHIGYPLRNISDVTYALKSRRDPNMNIGKIDNDKALREAFPGATYHHLKKAYRVVEWRSNSYERSIILEPVKDAPPTQALLRTNLGVSTDPAALIDGRLASGERGLIAEISLKVGDSVEGYRIGNNAFSYRDLVSKDRHMRRRMREFATTGVFLRIDEPWFSGSGDGAVKTRLAVSEALKAVLAREHNIAPAELRCAHQNIRLFSQGVGTPIDDGIVVFDNVVGGLRLSAPLFDDFPAVLGRLSRAVALAGEEALLDDACVERLSDWYESLGTGRLDAAEGPRLGADEYLVFAPRSEVGVRLGNEVVERTLLEPQLLEVNDTDVLMYRYESAPGSTAFVAHDRVQPLGGTWRHAIWCARSNAIREIAA